MNELRFQDEKGSIAPLAIGLVLLSFASIAVTVSASSLFVQHRRLQSLAESAAVASASLTITASEFLETLNVVYLQKFEDLSVAEEQNVDGQTFEVKLCSNWRIPFATQFASPGASICADGKARQTAN